VSSSQVTLSANASTTVSGATIDLVNSYHMSSASGWTQTCPGSYCYPSNPPTAIPLMTSCSVGCGSSGSPVAFTMSQPGIVRKNVDEKKSTIRGLSDGNIFENSDNSGGQKGICTSRGVRQKSGGGFGQNYWTTITDWTETNSICRNTCAGRSFDGRSSGPSDGGGVALSMQRISLSNLLDYNISNTNPGCVASSSYDLLMTSAAQSWTGDVTCAGGSCTFIAKASVDAAANLESDPVASVASGSGILTVTTSTAHTLQVGETVEFLGLQNTSCLNGLQNTGTVCGSATPGCSNPTSTTFTVQTNGCSTTGGTESGFSPTPIVQGPVGYQVFGLRQSDPVSVILCTGTNASNLNMPSATYGSHANVPTGISANASTASGAWTTLSGYNSPGWTAANTSVTYNWSSGANYSDDGQGHCLLTNIQGNPQQVFLTHATEITDAVSTVGNGPSFSGSTAGPSYQTKHLLRDSILTSSTTAPAAWYNISLGSSSSVEGTTTEVFNYDPNSMSACHLVWPGRSCSVYTEYENNTLSGTACNATCTGSCGTCNPPNTNTTFFFPANSCGVGFNGTGTWAYGTCTGNAVPVTGVSDYHVFELNSGSSYYGTASDSTDYGAHISAIDSAQTLNQYVCTPSSSCPGPGPFPDAP
jgi:hypothetical protein